MCIEGLAKLKNWKVTTHMLRLTNWPALLFLAYRQSKVGIRVERDRSSQRNVHVCVSGPVVDHGLEIGGQCELGITMANIRQPRKTGVENGRF